MKPTFLILGILSLAACHKVMDYNPPPGDTAQDDGAALDALADPDGTPDAQPDLAVDLALGSILRNPYAVVPTLELTPQPVAETKSKKSNPSPAMLTVFFIFVPFLEA